MFSNDIYVHSIDIKLYFTFLRLHNITPFYENGYSNSGYFRTSVMRHRHL